MCLVTLARPVWADGIDGEIYTFLLHQRHERTGLPASFINTDDAALHGQAATYDLALAGLAFLKLKDAPSARKILEFFERVWTPGGFCNFYDTTTGACGIEATIHLGPNMWVATLALWYTAETGRKDFYPLARKIALWAMALHHESGAISMGPYPDWGADWPHVFGAESNIVAYSVFRAIAREERDVARTLSLELEMQGIRDFLNEVVLVRGPDGTLRDILVGNSISGGNLVITACDVVAMMLLVFDPGELRAFFAVDEAMLVGFAREKFVVAADGIEGFDFSDEKTSQATRRPRMISLEWTMQMASALRRLAHAHAGDADVTEARENTPDYAQQAGFFAAQVDQKAIRLEGMRFYSYATKGSQQVFPFAPWWKTPSGDPARCGSMASTMWRLFYEKDFNPLGGSVSRAEAGS